MSQGDAPAQVATDEVSPAYSDGGPTGSTRPVTRDWRDLVLLLALLLLAFLVRQWHLGLPETRFFDETYYARSGEELLAGRPDTNTVHPPLAKLIIATVGYAYTAIGQPLQDAGWVGGVTDWAKWRAGSVLFGLLTLPLTYGLALRLFRSRFCAVIATYLLAIDFLHVVQSRITMLDMYLAFFILLGGWAAWRFIESDRNLGGWAVLSVLSFCIGFACKWNSLFAGLGAFVAMLALKRYPPDERPTRLDVLGRLVGWAVVFTPLAYRTLGLGLSQAVITGACGSALLHVWGVARVLPPLRGPGLWFTRLSMLYLVLLPTVYLASFVPFIWQHKWDLQTSYTDAGKNHKVMFDFRYGKEFTHRYMSQFWAWPTMMRPVWYHYEEHKTQEGSLIPPNTGDWLSRTAWRGQAPGQYVSGILAMGSPFVWWTFLVFLALTLAQSVLIPLGGVLVDGVRAMRAAPPFPPVEAPPAAQALPELPAAAEEVVASPRPEPFRTFRLGWTVAKERLDAWRFGLERPWLFLILMYAPQVLLWSINRGFFFYMLPCVPFMCVFIAAILREWLELPWGRLCAYVYLALATLFFLAYFPLLAGWSIPKPVYEFLIFTPKWI